jgi:hypothetical protein
MKKIVLSVLGSAMIFGVGTVVMAAGTNTVEDKVTFEKMKPLMEEMHPDSTTEELKEMYESCHGDNGMMKNSNMGDMGNMENMKNMDHKVMMDRF